MTKNLVTEFSEAIFQTLCRLSKEGLLWITFMRLLWDALTQAGRGSNQKFPGHRPASVGLARNREHLEV